MKFLDMSRILVLIPKLLRRWDSLNLQCKTLLKILVQDWVKMHSTSTSSLLQQDWGIYITWIEALDRASINISFLEDIPSMVLFCSIKVPLTRSFFFCFNFLFELQLQIIELVIFFMRHVITFVLANSFHLSLYTLYIKLI